MKDHILPVIEDQPISPTVPSHHPQFSSSPPHYSNKQRNIKGTKEQLSIRLLLALMKWIARFTKRYFQE